MKKKLLIFAVGLALLVAFILALSGPASEPPRYGLTFLGYTHGTGGVQAIFHVRQVPDVATAWYLQDVSRREGLEWRSWNSNQHGAPAVTLSNLNNQLTNLAAFVSVETTNEPSRIVIRIDETVGPRGVLAGFQVLWARMTDGEIGKKGRSYLLTNETVTLNAPP
jgi:hypothetical protein